VVSMVLCIAAWIDLPKGITTGVLIQSPSVTVTAPGQHSRLQTWLVKEGQPVTHGTPLALITLSKQTDTLRAPAAGKVRFLRKLTPGEALAPNAGLLMIESEAYSNYQLRVRIPEPIAAHIHLGRELAISLNRYAAEEFGELRAVIVSLPYHLPGSKELVADARLTHGLTTTKGKKLILDLQTTGAAFMVTGKRNLLRSLLHF
jgi:biotin-dependent enzyme